MTILPIFTHPKSPKLIGAVCFSHPKCPTNLGSSALHVTSRTPRRHEDRWGITTQRVSFAAGSVDTGAQEVRSLEAHGGIFFYGDSMFVCI